MGDLEDEIVNGFYTFNDPAFKNSDSRQAQDLIKQMLEKDPAKRIDATACLTHPFLAAADQKVAAGKGQVRLHDEVF